jgi:hypothetical protein
VAASTWLRRWMRPSSTSEPAVSASLLSSRSEFSALARRAFGPHPDQHDPLEPQRPVLDLADVLQLGGQARHPPQRVPLLQVQVTQV